MPVPPPSETARDRLTFDDGRAGDLAKRRTIFRGQLLQLRVLNTLEHAAQHGGLLYSGPRRRTLDAEGETAFATICAKHDGGQTLGYHAYHADPAIGSALPLSAAGGLPIPPGLDRLVRFLNAVAFRPAPWPDALFTPVFASRSAFFSDAAFLAAAARLDLSYGTSIVQLGTAPIVPILAESFAASVAVCQYVVGCRRAATLRTSYSVNPVSLPS